MIKENLEKILIERNITQKELSKKIGVSENTISNWMKGMEPSKESIKKLSEYFDKKPEYWNTKEKPEIEKKEKLPHITIAILEELKEMPESKQAEIFKVIKEQQEKNNKL